MQPTVSLLPMPGFKQGQRLSVDSRIWKRLLGFASPHDGVLLDAELRRRVDFLRSWVVDWVHTALQDGTFTTEVRLMIDESSASLGVTWDDLQEFLKEGWLFPAWGRVKCSQLFHVFDTRRCPSQDKVKASASELLGLQALLRHFVELYSVETPGLDDKVASFQAACDTIDTIALVKQGRVDMRRGAHMLRTAHSKHLEKHFGQLRGDRNDPETPFAVRRSRSMGVPRSRV